MPILLENSTNEAMSKLYNIESVIGINAHKIITFKGLYDNCA